MSVVGDRTTLAIVPDEDPTPTHVLTKAAVRWGIDTLGAQKLHPTFVMYLYLRAQDRAQSLDEASASSEDVLSLIRMPGNPTKPYYFPLIDRGVRTGNPLPSFWRNPNIPGSWSPGSIYRLKGGGWLGLASGGYTLPDDHLHLALKQMLYDVPVSALAMGAYFLRNDGFILTGHPTAADLIAAFRSKFDYPPSSETEFATLFTTTTPQNPEFEWFEASPQFAVDITWPDVTVSTELSDRDHPSEGADV